MTQEELKFLGFTLKVEGSSFWYELRVKNHLFITCDNYFAKSNKNGWIVGYSNKKSNEDTEWFNKNIDHVKKFVRIFEGITDYLHSLNGVYKNKIDWNLN